MALQVWLPLNGDIKNQGLANILFTKSGSGITTDSSGKIGSCYKRASVRSGGRIASNTTINLNGSISMFCWAKVTACVGDTANGLVSNHSHANNTGFGITVKLVSASDFRISCSTGNGSGRTYMTYYGTTNIKDKWCHLGLTYNKTSNTLKLWVNGSCEYTGTYTNSSRADYIWIFDWSTTYGDASYLPACSINDVRIYDHCLSEDEIHELSLGKVAHYPMNEDLPNLFLNSEFHLSSSDLAVTSSTDWTKYVRYYNGSPSLHSFANGEDTINLGSSGNIGISFLRKATDINLDTSSLYTISCEAKCSKPNATLDIGLSYYNNSNSWVWRGGTNPQAFTATNTWQKFTLTFTPDTDTKYISYCFTVIGASGHTFTLRKCKLEKGTIASKWIPVGDSKVHDISGNHYDLTVNGNPILSADSKRYSKSTYIPNGVTDYLVSPTIHIPGDAITTNIWIKSSNTSATGSYHMPFESESSGYMEMSISNGVALRGGLYINGTRYVQNVSGNVLDGKWHMITITYDGATIKRYVDGVLGNSTSVSGTLNATAQKYYFGKYGTNNSYASKEMYISDARLYSTALSADDVLKLYKLGN